MNVLITGAAGFIGSNLVKVFHRRHAVSVILRPSSRRDFLHRYDIRILEGDLRDREFVASAVKDFDLVIHAAAKAQDWGRYQEFHEANVECSLNLIESIDPGTRMIFLSSIAVTGEEDCPQAKAEASPYKPICPYVLESVLPSGMNQYRLSKTIAEQMLISKAETRGIDLTVLRPVWVFGPREFHAGPYEYCKTVQESFPVMPGSSRNLFHVVYVEDLARLILKVAEKQAAGVHIFNAGPLEVPLMDVFWDLFCRAMGRRKPWIIPPAFLYPFVILLEILWTLAGAKSPPFLTRARLYMFHASNVVSVENIRKTFDCNEFTPLSRAVTKTVRWWRLYKHLS